MQDGFAPFPSDPTPPAQTDAGAEVVSPLDVDRLRGLEGESVTVEGTVGHARVSRSGKVFRLFFEGSVEGDSLAVVWFPDHFGAMADAFGGEAGDGLFRERIRATGEVALYGGDPQVVVTDPSQIQVLPAER